MGKLALLLLLLVFAALTAACEIAVVAVSRLRLRKFASEGSKTAKLILKILEKPQKFFGTILVTNNIVGALIAVLVADIFLRTLGLSGGWVIVAATVVAAFLIIVSEVTAKTLAARYPESVSWSMARFLKILILVSAPIVKIFEVITETVLTAVDRGKVKKPSLVTEEEIRAFIKIGEGGGVLQKEKYKMLSRVFDFSEAVVKNVMTPKDKITAINIASGFEEILDTVLESGYSRIPVYKDSPDNIVGIINMKDLLAMSCNRRLFVLQDIVYAPTLVLEGKKVTGLLTEFQKGHTHIAVVVDEQKNVKGVITLEDLLEEIVGEIEDEYDIRSGPQER